MAIRANRTAVAVKLEDQYGVYNPPDFSTDVIEVIDLSLSPNVDSVERNLFRPTLSPAGRLPSKIHSEISFQVELKGGGLDANGKPLLPKYISLLKACGFDYQTITYKTATETFNGDGSTATFTLSNTPVIPFSESVLVNGQRVPYTIDYTSGTITFETAPADGSTISVSYEYQNTDTDALTQYLVKPVSDNIGSVSIVVYLDGLLYKIAGARGNVVISMEANNTAKLQFRFQGLYLDPESSSVPLTCTDETILPPLVKNAQTLLDRYFMPSLSTLEIDMNNSIVQRDDMNAEAGVGVIQITARNPEGNMNPDLVLPEEYNIWSKLKNAEFFEIRGQLGKDAGNTIKFAVPKALMTSLELAERDGIRIANIRFSCVGCDDEVQLFLK